MGFFTAGLRLHLIACGFEDKKFIPHMLLIIAQENILRGAAGLYKPLILGDAPP